MPEILARCLKGKLELIYNAACCDAPMYLLVLIILGLVSLAVIWQIHEYQKRADAREKEAEKADNDFSS